MYVGSATINILRHSGLDMIYVGKPAAQINKRIAKSSILCRSSLPNLRASSNHLLVGTNLPSSVVFVVSTCFAPSPSFSCSSFVCAASESESKTFFESALLAASCFAFVQRFLGSLLHIRACFMVRFRFWFENVMLHPTPTQ